MKSLRNAVGRMAAAIGRLGSAAGSEPREQDEFPARPTFGEGEDAALATSRLWLEAATERDVAAFALGEERRFAVDQAEQTLTLTFADGEGLVLRADALGSFNPHNRTFRWAWSNTSLDRAFAGASEAARSHRGVQGFPSFAAPIFEATFEDCRGLVAHAAECAGCVGVYRAITEDRVSVFLGYRQPSDDDVARLWRRGRANAKDVSEAQSIILSYDAAMFPFDVEYQQKLRANGSVGAEAQMTIINQISLRKLEQQNRFWRNANDDGELALSWPSPHDPKARSLLLATPRRAGGVYVIRGSGAHHCEAFILQRFEDGMRIVDVDVEWGAGLLRP